MGKKNINFEVEISFQSEVRVGNAFAAYLIRNTAKEAKKMAVMSILNRW